ncbi:glycosyltransferase family 4 protein [Haliea sp. E17]|uniref:glycosyltransferase family 4 protein n=1 Tax=Haliea sp. E17 TaxID=3401576 RepID=UPI003AADA844
MEYLYSWTVALFLTIALIPLLIRLSVQLGLVDDPSAERKVHSVLMPRTGGLGIIIGAALPLLFLLPMEGYLLYLFVGCAIIVIFGLFDDRLELSYKWKLFGQSLAAIVVMSGGIVAYKLPFLGLENAPLWLSYPITFFFLVGVVNGVNFSDGLDGLAAGTSVMALLLIFLLALHAENTNVALISLTVVGGVLGFLRYNTFPANIFMGDAGSQFLGFVIACLAILVTQKGIAPYSAFLPILILGIPIMDILQVVPVRIKKNLPLPGPDKEHFHHQIAKLGFRHTDVVALVYVLQAILLSGAFLLRYHSDLAVATFYVTYVVLILGLLLLANFTGWHFRGKDREAQFESRRAWVKRRLAWYAANCPRLIALLVSAFFVLSGWYLSPGGNSFSLALVMCVSCATCWLLAKSTVSRQIFRVVLYLASVAIAYFLLFPANLGLVETSSLLAFAVLMVAFLTLGIYLTGQQDFRLTTQDLLILLVVLLLPLLPIEVVDRYALGRVVLLVALLMYASEFVLLRTTRMVAICVGCALASVAVVLGLP